MTITVVGHRLLIKQETLEEVDPVYAAAKAAGIKLAELRDTQRERKAVDRGVVVGMGANAFKAFDDGNKWCEVGDKVVFAKYGGYLITDPETKEEFVCLNDEDVLAIVKGSK